MNPKIKFVAVAILSVLIVVIFLGWRRARNSEQNRALKIGGIFSLTGDYAIIGDDINKGALLAVQDAKKNGVNVDFISEDDEFQPAKTVSAATKLLNIDQVDAVVTPWAPEVKPIASLVDQAKVPLLSVWDNTNFMKTAGPYVFTIGFSTEGNGKKIADFAFNSLRLRRVAVLSQVEEWSQTISRAFIDEFQNLGGEVVLSQSSQLTDTDFRAAITKIESTNADGVYFPLNAPANSVFLKQSRQLGLRVKMLTGDAFIQDEIDAAGPAANGVYFTNIYAENTAGIVQEYKTAYGTDPGSPAVISFGYDGINTVLAAYQLALTKHIPLRDALTMVHIQGAGALIDMAGRQYADRIEKVYQVIGNTPQVVAGQ